MDASAPTWKSNSVPAAERGHRRLIILIGVGVVLSVVACAMLWMLQPPPSLRVILIGNDRSPFLFENAVDWRNISRDELRLRLNNWKDNQDKRSTLLFLSGTVHLSVDGALILGTADDRADHQRNPLSLGEFLDRLHQFRSGLLVLDFTCLETDWVPIARKAVEERPDLPWSVLFARSRGETDTPGLDGVLNSGLHGLSDGWNSAQVRDQRISYAELAAYVRHRRLTDVSSLSQSILTPWWIERGAAVSFAAAPSLSEEQSAIETRSYPQELRAVWPTDHDTDSKRAFLFLEKRWLRGEKVETLLKDMAKPTTTNDIELTAAVQNWSNRLLRPKPGEKAPALTEDVLLAVLKQSEPWTREMLLELAAASKGSITEPRSAATLQLWRAATDRHETEWPLFLRLLKATVAWEEFAMNPTEESDIAKAEQQSNTAWAAVFAHGYCALQTSEKAISTFEDTLRQLQQKSAWLREVNTTLQKMDTLASLQKPSSEFVAIYQALQQKSRNAIGPALQLLQQDFTKWNEEQRLPSVQRVRAGTNSPRDWALLRQWLDTGLGTFEDRAVVWDLWLMADAQRLRNQQLREQNERTIQWIDPSQERPAEAPPAVRWRGASQRSSPNSTDWLNWQARRAGWNETNPWGFVKAEEELAWARRQRLNWQARGGEVKSFCKADIHVDSATWPANSNTLPLSASVRLLHDSVGLPIKINIETPLANEVSVAPETMTLPGSIQQSTLTWQAKLNSPAEQGVSLKGAFLRLETQDGPVFARLPIDTRAISQPLRLLVAQGDDKPLSLDKLILRSNGTTAVYNFAVASRSLEPRRLIVECPALQLTTGEVALAPQSSSTLVLQRAPAPIPVVEPVRMKSLDFTVRDATTKAILQTLTLPLEAADPRSFITNKSASLRPTTAGVEINIQLQRNGILTSALPIKIEFPQERNKGLIVRNGLLGSLIQPTDNLLSLSASLHWATGQPKVFEAHLNVDNSPRAVVFRGDATNLTSDTALSVQTMPSLRLVTASAHDGNRPLTVKVECDAEPADATVQCSIGTGRDEGFQSEFVSPRIACKTTEYQVRSHPSGGLSIAATRKDTTVEIPVGRLAGKRWLRGELRDGQGKVLMTEWVQLVFDADPPQGLKFVDLLENAERNKSLKINLEVEPPLGGLKDLRVFTGASMNGEPEPGIMVFQAKPVDAKQRQWVVTIPMEDRLGAVVLHASARSNSGRTSTIQQTIERVDAADLAREKPGELSGLLVEGDIAQPKLEVKLTDAKKKVLTTTTDENGRFRFVDLKPGNYTLSAVKSSTNRAASLPVIVKADRITKADLSLLLQSP